MRAILCYMCSSAHNLNCNGNRNTNYGPQCDNGRALAYLRSEVDNQHADLFSCVERASAMTKNCSRKRKPILSLCFTANSLA